MTEYFRDIAKRQRAEERAAKARREWEASRHASIVRDLREVDRKIREGRP